MPATRGTGQTKDTPAAAVSILESHLELPAPAWLNSPTEPTSTLTVFSLLPRCHGQYASQKYTGMPVAEVSSACRVISVPRSQVRVLRIGSVSLRNAWATAAVTVALVASVTGSTSR
jgi:hypothetical protein